MSLYSHISFATFSRLCIMYRSFPFPSWFTNVLALSNPFIVPSSVPNSQKSILSSFRPRRTCTNVVVHPIHHSPDHNYKGGYIPRSLFHTSTSALSVSSVSRKGSAVLRSNRIMMRKRFGQHLLKNPDIVESIVEAADIQPHESIFEIGPGTGNLTVHLLKRARVVYAAELDPRLYEILLNRVALMDQHQRQNETTDRNESTFESKVDENTNTVAVPYSSKLLCVRDDFLKIPLPPFDALVANIPYQISSPVLYRIFNHQPLPKRALIMFQYEFALRMVAKPSTSMYCRLSVNSQLLGNVRLVMKIKKEQFRPPPKVDSAVIELVPKGWPSNLNFPHWDYFLRIAFSNKNKKLRTVFLYNKTVLVRLTLLREYERKNIQNANLSDLKENITDNDDDNLVPAVTLGDTIEEEKDNGLPSGGAEEENIQTSAGTITRQQSLQTRQDLERIFTETNMLDKRANGMTIPEFRLLFETLYNQQFRFLTTAEEEKEHLKGTVNEEEWYKKATALAQSKQDKAEIAAKGAVNVTYAESLHANKGKQFSNVSTGTPQGKEPVTVNRSPAPVNIHNIRNSLLRAKKQSIKEAVDAVNGNVSTI